MRGKASRAGLGDSARDAIPLTPNPSPPSTGERGEGWCGASVKGDLPRQYTLLEWHTQLEGRLPLEGCLSLDLGVHFVHEPARQVFSRELLIVQAAVEVAGADDRRR